MKTLSNTWLVAAVLATLTVAGCGSAPTVPSDSFQAADIAITTADQDKAAEFAPVELKSARDKLLQARAAVAKNPDEKDVLAARRLADEAQADAELASARARNGRAEAVNAELKKNNDVLQQELLRSTGTKS